MDRKIKYAYFDLDGTLLNSQKKLTKATESALVFLRKKGIKYGIATGRPVCMIQDLLVQINAQLPVISSNGALVSTFKNKKFSHRSMTAIKKPLAEAIKQLLIKKGITFLLYTPGAMFYFDSTKNSEWIKWVKVTWKKASYKWDLIEIHKALKLDEFDVLKFLVISGEHSDDKIDKLKKSIDNQNDIYWVNSQAHVLDIMAKNISKGKALQQIASLKEIDLSQTIAFGDSMNDIEMFKVCQTSVAMADGAKAVKESANYVTQKGHDQEGLSEFILKWDQW